MMYAYEYRNEILDKMELIVADLWHADWVGTRPGDLQEAQIKWEYLNQLNYLYWNPSVWGADKVRPHFDGKIKEREQKIKAKMTLLRNTIELEVTSP